MGCGCGCNREDGRDRRDEIRPGTGIGGIEGRPSCPCSPNPHTEQFDRVVGTWQTVRHYRVHTHDTIRPLTGPIGGGCGCNGGGAGFNPEPIRPLEGSETVG